MDNQFSIMPPLGGKYLYLESNLSHPMPLSDAMLSVLAVWMAVGFHHANIPIHGYV